MCPPRGNFRSDDETEDLIVVFPFRVYLPSQFTAICRTILSKLKALPPRSSINGHQRHTDRWSMHVDYSNLPVAAVLFLLSTTAIDGNAVRKGIVGDEGIHPLDIMALFISLVCPNLLSRQTNYLTSSKAYLAISLDSTGLLRFLAFWVAKKAGSSGRRLYVYLYAFFFWSGVVIGNVSLQTGFASQGLIELY